MKQIHITRDGSGNVKFETVSVDVTDTVFFTNQDPKAAHWPTLATNQLGPAPSPNSSQCTLPTTLTPPTVYTYGCKIAGHGNEKGIINLFAQLAAGTTSLAAATKGQPITKQQVVVGGASPYTISGQLFQITDPATGKVLQSGSGIGPGLQLSPTTNNTGVWVGGTPTVSGLYTFTFTVNDGMGGNLQQVQYTMKVA